MPLREKKTITMLLDRANSGEPGSEAELFAAVYEELRSMAASRVRAGGPGGILQATALVNEAYLKLSEGKTNWDGRAHFFSAAARSMRNILVDQVRRQSSRKHGGDLKRVQLETTIQGSPSLDLDRVLDINRALDGLTQQYPRAAKVVEMRYFVGLNDQETATALEVSARTVYREWAFAKAWLKRELDIEISSG